MGFQFCYFPADKLVNLSIREMPKPNKFHMAKCSCIVFRRNLAPVVEVLDIDSSPGLKPRLFFIRHEALSIAARLF